MSGHVDEGRLRAEIQRLAGLPVKKQRTDGLLALFDRLLAAPLSASESPTLPTDDWREMECPHQMREADCGICSRLSASEAHEMVLVELPKLDDFGFMECSHHFANWQVDPGASYCRTCEELNEQSTATFLRWQELFNKEREKHQAELAALSASEAQPAIPVNSPMCNRCGKMFLDCHCRNFDIPLSRMPDAPPEEKEAQPPAKMARLSVASLNAAAEIWQKWKSDIDLSLEDLAEITDRHFPSVRAVSDTTAISGYGENLRDKSPQRLCAVTMTPEEKEAQPPVLGYCDKHFGMGKHKESAECVRFAPEYIHGERHAVAEIPQGQPPAPREFMCGSCGKLVDESRGFQHQKDCPILRARAAAPEGLPIDTIIDITIKHGYNNEFGECLCGFVSAYPKPTWQGHFREVLTDALAASVEKGDTEQGGES